MKSSFYFKHDLDAREDDKMRSLIYKLGATGYGIYWMVVEDLYRNRGRLNRDYAVLSKVYRQPQPKVKAVVEDFSAFYDAKGKIACKRVDRDLKERNELSEKGRAYAARRWKDGQPMGTHRDPNARRGEDRKGEERDRPGTPSLFKVQEFSKTVPGFRDPERFFDYYAATGWIVRGEPIVDWQALARRWVKTSDKEKAVEAEEAKKLKCQNRNGCGLAGNWIEGKGPDGTDLCASCLNDEAVKLEIAK